MGSPLLEEEEESKDLRLVSCFCVWGTKVIVGVTGGNFVGEPMGKTSPVVPIPVVTFV